MGEKGKQDKKEASKADMEKLLNELMGIDQMFSDFIAAETEGMIICDNCYDNVFDDDENICQCEDEEGNIRTFCCKECMKEWKNRG